MEVSSSGRSLRLIYLIGLGPISLVPTSRALKIWLVANKRTLLLVFQLTPATAPIICIARIFIPTVPIVALVLQE